MIIDVQLFKRVMVEHRVVAITAISWDFQAYAAIHETGLGYLHVEPGRGGMGAARILDEPLHETPVIKHPPAQPSPYVHRQLMLAIQRGDPAAQLALIDLGEEGT